MTALQKKVDAVRSAWRRTEIFKGGATLLADAIIVILALVAIDAIYHLPASARLLLLAAGLAALAGAAFLVLFRPLKRQLADSELALYVEGRFPALNGMLLAAVEYEQYEVTDQVQAGLVGALVIDCLDKAAQFNIADVIDKRRLKQRAIIAAVLLAFFMGAVLIRPDLLKHQLARVLLPWVDVPMSDSEKEIQHQREEAQARADLVLKQIEEAAKPVAIELHVTPGNAEVARGSQLAIEAGANKINGPLFLLFKSSDGQQHKLELAEDPARPEHFTKLLSDLSEDLSYKVVMNDVQSPEFTIKIFDPASIKNLRLTYHYPKYMDKADRTVTGMDGTIEALEGTTVDVTLAASSPLRDGKLTLNSGKSVPMPASGSEVSGTIVVEKSGDYALAATDMRGTSIAPPTRFSITALQPASPTLEVVYPGIDTLVHSMEEIAFAAKIEGTIGIKEVRLHSFYNSDPEEIQHISGRESGGPATSKLAEFTIDLEKRSNVHAGDTILFHFEAEDMKGQVASSDVYAVTVRALESFTAYGYHPVMPAHGYAGPALINVIGAAWDLHTKETTMSAEQFKSACEKIARALESPDGH